MYPVLSGYQVNEKLHQSHCSFVYRGHREEDGQPVVIKILRPDHPTTEQITRFRREYEITSRLGGVGAIRTYGLENYEHSLAMILEDFGGESLDKLLRDRRLDLVEFVDLALRITACVDAIHQQNIIHKNIKPSNIVWNPQIDQVKVIDFGLATALSKENTKPIRPGALEGTLAYMSPEQTGRMNRAIDYRTDFYSLGITFYEMLAGSLPFQATDPMELIHAHLARTPSCLHDLNPQIPLVVSNMVTKLMAKTPEERYQTGPGLQADLQKCLNQIQETGTVMIFTLGQYDISHRFQLPQKLYGRSTEIKTLLAAVERLLDQGQTELVLVSGEAGIGKSVSVRELHEPLARQRGYFVAGKFDKFQRNTPYQALIQAFGDLICQLLGEGETQLALWRENFLTALGSNGQIIIDIIPEMELIIGPQPSVPALPPIETQNRFNLTMQSFVRVVATTDHPLIIFVDDLQWSDTASLKLIELFMTDPKTKYMLIIGTYRDNEVGPAHPLMLTLAELRKTGVTTTQLSLSPLDLPSITHFIADTLSCSRERVRPLAELTLTKTIGNPFFIKEFLKSLYAEGLLIFAPPSISDDGENAERGWQWDMSQIQTRDITDNVVELMANKIQQFPSEAQDVLRLAACIGDQFDLKTLAMVNKKPLDETSADLYPSVVEGLVLPLGSTYRLIGPEVPQLESGTIATYRFGHDRIQQAAYSLIPEADKEVLHWQIGLLMWKDVPSSKERHKRIFDIVNHLNLGQSLITDQSEKKFLAELNLLAGQKAKTATAYGPALNYLRLSLNLLEGEGWWETDYDLMLSLHVNAAEAVCLTGDFENMERLVEIALQKARTLLDKIQVYEIKIRACTARHNPQEAAKTTLLVLRLLDVKLPQKPSNFDVLLGLMGTKLTLAGKRIESLVDLPEMTDPYKLAVVRLLKAAGSSLYIVSPKLLALLVFKTVSLSVRYGNSAHSAFAYAAYGFLLCGKVGDIETGYRFGELALRVLDRFEDKELKPSVLMLVSHFIQHWKEYLRDTLPSLLETYRSGLEIGDLEYVAYSTFLYCTRLYFSGENLAQVESKIASFTQVTIQARQETALKWFQLYRQVILNLTGRSESPYRLSGDHYDEEQMMPLHLKGNDRTAIFDVYFHKMILCYLFQEYRQGIKNANRAEEYLDSVMSTELVPLFHFYHSLTLLAVYPDAQKPEQKHILGKIISNQKKMKKWAQHAPRNYSHRFYLVEAERARVLGKDGVAGREYYDQAIVLARKDGYLNEEALAHELAAQFHLTKGHLHLAHYYLREAHYIYTRWGGIAKVKDLEVKHPELFNPQLQGRNGYSFDPTITIPLTMPPQGGLDITSILKASQAISSEIVLDRLLAMLLEIVIENAGAQVGYLLLEEQDGDGTTPQWVIEATRSVDQPTATVLQSIPVKTKRESLLPATMVNYVAHTQETVVLSNAAAQGKFTQDPYVIARQPKSVLCTPLLNRGKLIGILYLENNLAHSAFTEERLKVLKLLSAQAAISLENARLYNYLSQQTVETEKMTQLLTNGERKVLSLAAQGLKNQAIAEQLSLSEKTISNRLTNIYQKLNVDNRTQAILYALRKGWVKLEESFEEIE